MNKKIIMRVLAGVLAAGLLLALTAACGARGLFETEIQRTRNGAAAPTADMSITMESVSGWGGSAAPPAAVSPETLQLGLYSVQYGAEAHRTAAWEDIAGQAERHLIRRASMELESERFEETVAALRATATDANGYIESEVLTTTGTPRLTMVLRVPQAAFEDTLRRVGELAEVRTQQQWSEDVTDRFYDLAGNLETRRIEEERVLALIEQAEDIHELLALESRLSGVRLAIESYLSQLTLMAGQITYATLTVTLVCTAAAPAEAVPTLGSRIGGAFGDSVSGTVAFMQHVAVFLAGAVIPLVLAAVFGSALWFVVRYIRARRKASALH